MGLWGAHTCQPLLGPPGKFVVVHFSQTWGVSARDAKASPHLGRSGVKPAAAHGRGVGGGLEDSRISSLWETRKLPAFPFLRRAYRVRSQGQTRFPECHVRMLPPCCPPPAFPSLEPLDGCVSTDSELIKSYLSSAVDTAPSRLACADACVPRGLQEILCPTSEQSRRPFCHGCSPDPSSFPLSPTPSSPLPPQSKMGRAWLEAPSLAGRVQGGG